MDSVPVRFYGAAVLGLNFGETFLVAFIVIMVVSVKYWPAAGAKIATRLVGRGPR